MSIEMRGAGGRGRKDLAIRERALDLRRTGMTLEEIGRSMGISRERVRQLIATSEARFCRDCSLPVEILPGRRLCRKCYAARMANRPSKVAKRTGYRRNKVAHQRAAAVRLARSGKTRDEIAEAMGVPYSRVAQWFLRMRQKGRIVQVRRKPKESKRK